MRTGAYVVTSALSLVLIGCVQGPGSGTPLPSPSASPIPLSTDLITAKAQSIVDGFSHTGRPAAAAFVTTTYERYAGSRPDGAGIQGSPSLADVVIVVEIDGRFGLPSCPPMAPCVATGIVVAFDQTLNRTLETTYYDDPWSPDRPSPAPSVGDRFAFIRRFGTPVALQLPN